MKPIRILLALCALAITGALLAGCGDDDDASDADPQTVLEDTFNNETRLTSGNLTLSASVEAEGEQGGSFEGSLSGPYQADPENPAAIPQVDWSVSSSGEIAGEPLDFEGGLVLTDDNAFVEYGGATYEVGAETYAPIKEQLDAQAAATDTESATSFQAACEQALSQAGASDASACDIDPIGWLSNVTNEGTEDVGGAESVHIHGDANLDQILEDIGGFISAIPGAAAEIDPAQISLLEGAVETASVDVYSTEDENLLSKLDVNLTLDLGAFAGSGAPVSTVDITFGTRSRTSTRSRRSRPPRTRSRSRNSSATSGSTSTTSAGWAASVAPVAVAVVAAAGERPTPTPTSSASSRRVRMPMRSTIARASSSEAHTVHLTRTRGSGIAGAPVRRLRAP